MFPHNEVCAQGNLPLTCNLKSADAETQDPWQVLHVRSNYERRVAQHLAVRSVEHYVPLYQERVKWTDRSVMTERALFPGYVFVRFARCARTTVISTPGVVRWLGDEQASVVRWEELERIRQGLASGLLLRPHPHVAVGQRVRVRSGIFEGAEGVVAEFRQRCKVVITLDAVRQCFSMEVELGDLEALKSKPVVVVARPRLAFGD